MRRLIVTSLVLAFGSGLTTACGSGTEEGGGSPTAAVTSPGVTNPPTAAPTEAPSQAASAAPTDGETSTPSHGGTSTPVFPTDVVPTDEPTEGGTSTPTAPPTQGTTPVETDAPTGAVTSVPTQEPTGAVSQPPTAAETAEPTGDEGTQASPTEASSTEASPTEASPTEGGTGTPLLDGDGDGYAPEEGDCDDEDPEISPDAEEICDEIDNNCDETIDEGTLATWYLDVDDDGYGGATSTLACVPPGGYAAVGGDCNDGNAAINPGAAEVCDAVDNDCDAKIDDKDTGVTGTSTWYPDPDDDGYGGPAPSVQACSAPAGTVAIGGDCDDTRADVNPDADEICNRIDDDCNGYIDDADPWVTGYPNWYTDEDGDGAGGQYIIGGCEPPTDEAVTNNDDCNDASADIAPGKPERCNQIDDDCDGDADEGLPTQTWYLDGDNDGFGGSGAVQACAQPNDTVSNNTDCDDTAATIYPSATETCNGLDDDCDTTIDEAAASECPGEDTTCQTRTCKQGTCGFDFADPGTFVSDPTEGDCSEIQCNGAGVATAAPNDEDLPPADGACLAGACSGGVPSNQPVPRGTSCNEDGGLACSAAGKCEPTFTVLRVGDGAAALGGAATAVFLEEHLLDGSLRNVASNPLALPTSPTDTNAAFTLTGTSTSEGMMTRSADGRYLVVAGYNAGPGTANPSGGASATTNRVIARIAADRTIDTTTRMTSAFSASNVRGAASHDGTGFWVSGNGSSGTAGVQYVAFGSSGASVQVLANPNNARNVAAYGGQLYGTSGSGTFVNVFSVGSGLPTGTGSTATSLAGMPTASASPYAFVLFDLNPEIAGLDTLYVADDRASTSGGGLQKWTFNGSTWGLKATYNVGTNGPRGLTGFARGGVVTLIATSSESSNNKAWVVVDDGTNTPTPVAVTSSGQNTAYRGIALTPQ